MNRIKFNRPVQKNNFTTVLDDLFNTNFGELLDSDFSKKSPAVNIIESENAFIIEFAAPGLKKEDFVINIEKDQLIVSSKKVNEETKDETKSNISYKRREFNYSTFRKSFHLSKDIDISKIDAKYEDGILSVSLEKREEAKAQEARTINVL